MVRLKGKEQEFSTWKEKAVGGHRAIKNSSIVLIS